jgi:hypothetical protein
MEKLTRYKIQPCPWFFEITKLLHKNQGTKFHLTKLGFSIFSQTAHPVAMEI